MRRYFLVVETLERDSIITLHESYKSAFEKILKKMAFMYEYNNDELREMILSNEDRDEEWGLDPFQVWTNCSLNADWIIKIMDVKNDNIKFYDPTQEELDIFQSEMYAVIESFKNDELNVEATK